MISKECAKAIEILFTRKRECAEMKKLAEQLAPSLERKKSARKKTDLR